MNDNTLNQQPHPSKGPIAQQLTKLHSNGDQVTASSTIGQKPSAKQALKRQKFTTGFANKTLWDWLGVVLVPIMLAIFTIAISLRQITVNQQQHDSDQKIASDNHQADLARQEDQQREATLNSYMNDITSLLLTAGLRTSKSIDEVRVVARAETLSALRQLDGVRKGTAIRFLSEARLITSSRRGIDVIIKLTDANLNGAQLNSVDLQGAELFGADLSDTKLFGAQLKRADLGNADLSNANLSGKDSSGSVLNGAKVTGEQLAKAISLHFATLPNGSSYP